MRQNCLYWQLSWPTTPNHQPLRTKTQGATDSCDWLLFDLPVSRYLLHAFGLRERSTIWGNYLSYPTRRKGNIPTEFEYSYPTASRTLGRQRDVLWGDVSRTLRRRSSYFGETGLVLWGDELENILTLIVEVSISYRTSTSRKLFKDFTR
jgi:hypothetical protein